MMCAICTKPNPDCEDPAGFAVHEECVVKVTAQGTNPLGTRGPR